MTSRSLISLFAGAGGLDIGLERAGFTTIAATDFDTSCAATLEVNMRSGVSIETRPGRAYLEKAAVIQADIADLSGRDLNCKGVEVDLLAGGPPCQPFSSAGLQRSIRDPRGRLFEHFIRLADEIRPRAILFENVRGIVTARGATGTPGEVLEHLRDQFHDIGYSSSVALLNAADFGAPQRRVRFFLMATRDGRPLDFPRPTHADPKLGCALPPWISLREFLDHLSPPAPAECVTPTPALAAQLEALPDGSGLKSAGRAEPSRPGGHWGYRQGTFIADLGKPARTVTASSTQDWVRMPGQPLRRLTLREVSALQGFPVAWEFVGNKASRFRQVGNAVPARFGEVLGHALMSSLDAGAPAERRPPAALPKDMVRAINYTRRDELRNGSSRPRSDLYAGEVA